MNFGIVGYGRFGQLLAKSLMPYGEVRVCDVNQARFSSDSLHMSSTLELVAASDILFLAVPISVFESMCLALKPYVQPSTTLVDCCSVKIFPIETMLRVFSNEQPIIGTHPLFGPDSVKRTNGLVGHRIVVCPVRCASEQLDKLSDLFNKMGLMVIGSTADDHDRQMARSQGLIHFIGRGLESLDLQPQVLSTPDFQSLLNINTMVVNDSWQLFLDMHRYNPHAKIVRTDFMKKLIDLDESIDSVDKS